MIKNSEVFAAQRFTSNNARKSIQSGFYKSSGKRSFFSGFNHPFGLIIALFAVITLVIFTQFFMKSVGIADVREQAREIEAGSGSPGDGSSDVPGSSSTDGGDAGRPVKDACVNECSPSKNECGEGKCKINSSGCYVCSNKKPTTGAGTSTGTTGPTDKEVCEIYDGGTWNVDTSTCIYDAAEKILEAAQELSQNIDGWEREIIDVTSSECRSNGGTLSADGACYKRVKLKITDQYIKGEVLKGVSPQLCLQANNIVGADGTCYKKLNLVEVVVGKEVKKVDAETCKANGFLLYNGKCYASSSTDTTTTNQTTTQVPYCTKEKLNGGCIYGCTPTSDGGQCKTPSEVGLGQPGTTTGAASKPPGEEITGIPLSSCSSAGGIVVVDKCYRVSTTQETETPAAAYCTKEKLNGGCIYGCTPTSDGGQCKTPSEVGLGQTSSSSYVGAGPENFPKATIPGVTDAAACQAQSGCWVSRGDDCLKSGVEVRGPEYTTYCCKEGDWVGKTCDDAGVDLVYQYHPEILKKSVNGMSKIPGQTAVEAPKEETPGKPAAPTVKPMVVGSETQCGILCAHYGDGTKTKYNKESGSCSCTTKDGKDITIEACHSETSIDTCKITSNPCIHEKGRDLCLDWRDPSETFYSICTEEQTKDCGKSKCVPSPAGSFCSSSTCSSELNARCSTLSKQTGSKYSCNPETYSCEMKDSKGKITSTVFMQCNEDLLDACKSQDKNFTDCTVGPSKEDKSLLQAYCIDSKKTGEAALVEVKKPGTEQPVAKPATPATGCTAEMKASCEELSSDPSEKPTCKVNTNGDQECWDTAANKKIAYCKSSLKCSTGQSCSPTTGGGKCEKSLTMDKGTPFEIPGTASTCDDTVDDGYAQWPVNGVITTADTYETGASHVGGRTNIALDLDPDLNTANDDLTIYAPESGEACMAAKTEDLGNIIRVVAEVKRRDTQKIEKVEFRFEHVADNVPEYNIPECNDGGTSSVSIQKGQPIGVASNTGNLAGSSTHLHMEVGSFTENSLSASIDKDLLGSSGLVSQVYGVDTKSDPNNAEIAPSVVCD
jgi:hypothetical protein